MTVLEAIAQADELRPNAVPDDCKRQWVLWLDGMLRRDVAALHEDAPAAPDASDPNEGDGDAPLLAGEPDGMLYVYWLTAQIDWAEGETARYANDMLLYNAALAEFASRYKAAHRPVRRGQFRL